MLRRNQIPYFTWQKHIEMIMEKNLLNDDGIIIFETDREEQEIKEIENYVIVRDLRKYGRIKLLFLNRKE